MDESKLIITPKTKVLQLIEAYPQLEDVLISYVPAFSKLKNPVLRKTVARIATLQQAATVGGVKVEDLINRLRKEVGQDLITVSDASSYTLEKPSWYDESGIIKTLDIRSMLAAGEHPVNQVMTDLYQLKTGEIYKVLAPFIPAPLIDKATALNISHWIRQLGDEEFEVYFTRP